MNDFKSMEKVTVPTTFIHDGAYKLKAFVWNEKMEEISNVAIFE